MHLVYFEPYSGGHCAAYAKIFADHLANDSRWDRVTWVVNPGVVEQVARIDGILERSGSSSIVVLTQEELAALHPPNLLRRGLREWRLACELSARYAADHIFIPFLDHALVGIAFGKPLPQGKVAGFVFRSIAPIYNTEGNVPFAERLKRQTKLHILKWAAQKEFVSRVLVLDPQLADFLSMAAGGRAQVTAVLDPLVLPIESSNALCASASGNIVSQNHGRVTFLLFGALSKRKGIFVLLDALRHLTPALDGRCHYQIVGRLDADDRDGFVARLADLRRERPRLSIELEDDFVSDEHLAELLKCCDVVLLPHQGQIGSSGTMVWSAYAGKPIITQDTGLTGHLTREYRLGETVDTNSPGALANSIRRMIEFPAIRTVADTDRQRFLKGRSATDFYTKIVAAMTGTLRQ